MLGCRFSFVAYAKNVREKTTKRSFKTTEALLVADGHVLLSISLIFIKVPKVQIVLKVTQTLEVLIFFKFCPMSGLKFSKFNVTSVRA